MKREKHLETVCEAANSYIGLARLKLSQGDPDAARRYLDEYCQEHDRLEVRYIGADMAQRLLDSGIIHPTTAWQDEIAKLSTSTLT